MPSAGNPSRKRRRAARSPGGREPVGIGALTHRAMEIRARFAAMERRKFRRPWTREEIMQGFVGDVGDLMKLVMAKSGVREADDLERKLAHELADCLWSLLVLSKLYGVDLEEAFLATMDDLECRISARVAAKPGR
jgi:NTP pyrophosphatase (non-canonical NTP hydrolase)